MNPNPTWKEAFYRALISGSAASILSSFVLAWRGRQESGSAAGPINGPSQWIWGPSAARKRRASLRHTATGYAIHHSASVGWATVYEKHVAGLTAGKPLPQRLLACSAMAAFACFVDYRIARGRLQPGFEKQLSRGSLLMVYGAFALGLALGPDVTARSARLRPRAVKFALSRT